MLVLEQVTKEIRHNKVVEELSLHVREGVFCGLLGKPGSGKSVVLGLCAGLLEPSCGNIRIDGCDMKSRENRKLRGRLVGYMGPKDGSYPRLQVLEYLEIYAHAAGLSGLSARQRCMEVLAMAGLERKSERPVEEQSVSVRRQLSLLRAIIHRPKLLLLDEPFAGTQAAQRMAMEELLTNLSAEGMTILMASGSLPEASGLCQELAIMEKGHIVTQGPVGEVLKRSRSEAPLYIRVCGKENKAMEVLHREPQVTSISVDGSHFLVHFLGNAREEAMLLARLAAEGIPVYSFCRGQSSLEDLQI